MLAQLNRDIVLNIALLTEELTLGLNRRQLTDYYSAIAYDIHKFCAAMRFDPTDQQNELLQAVAAGNRKIAVKSGQGPGKTTVSVIIALQRLLRDVDAMTLVTAPTMRQVRDVWLAEARRLMKKADPFLRRLFNITKTKIEVAGCPDWGVKTMTATDEESAQGFHNKNMDIIVEEASGVDRGLITQLKGTASNPDALMLLIGNPNTRDCAFFDCFNAQRHKWHSLTFNAEHTPASEWFDPQRNRDLEEEFGRESDVYRIRVLGEFPHSDPNCVLSTEICEAIMERRLLLPCSQIRLEDGTLPRQIGLDFARFGGDENTIFRRMGNSIMQWDKYPHTEPSRVIDTAFRWQKEAVWKDADTLYVADADGMGAGVMVRFHDADKQVIEFHNGGKASSSDYENKITQAWFNFRKIAKAQKAYIPRDNLLLQQLCGRRYYTTKKGKLVLESKDDYMKRGYDSPDRADGMMYGFWDGGYASTQIAESGEGEDQNVIKVTSQRLAG